MRCVLLVFAFLELADRDAFELWLESDEVLPVWVVDELLLHEDDEEEFVFVVVVERDNLVDDVHVFLLEANEHEGRGVNRIFAFVLLVGVVGDDRTHFLRPVSEEVRNTVEEETHDHGETGVNIFAFFAIVPPVEYSGVKEDEG